MCNQNSCFGGSSCCWIIIAIILLFLFCGNGCGNGCGCGAITAAAGAAAEDLPRITRPRRKAGTSFFAGRSAIQPHIDKNNADKHRF